MTAHVLVVDDESDLELLISQRFRKEIKAGEIRFSFAINGLDALDVLKAEPTIEVVLTDLNMPKLDGLGLLGALSEFDQPPSAIVLSAYGDMRNIREAMNRGAFDFLTKPIDFKDLKITLQKTLAHAEKLRSAETARREKEAAQEEALIQERKAKETQRQLVEHLKRMDRLKDEFLANTSHELRTPLNGIIGVVESVLDGAAGVVGEEMRVNLEMVADSGRRLTRLVDDILDFAKLKDGQIAMTPKPVSLTSIIQTVISLSKPLAASKNLDLSAELAEDLPLVHADPNRVEQILFNLVGNAVKFTNHGSVQVQARVENDLMRIAVVDTGIGISPNNFEHIFNMFEQLDDSDTRIQGGTGLGLAITRKLVELSGGEIHLHSEVGKGSEFWFTLPISGDVVPVEIEATDPPRVDAPSIQTPRPTQPTVTVGSKDQRRILVVDDVRVNQHVLSNHLKLQNYDVCLADDGATALQELEENGRDYHLVILDVMMPGMSGFEVCRILRDTYARHELPVLMLTARSQVGDLTKGLEVGANDYLTKPFDKRELLARVETLISLKVVSDQALTQATYLAREQRRVADLSQQTEHLRAEVHAQETATYQARESNRRKTDFLAMMSHELRTPLNAIIGYTEIIFEDLELNGMSVLTNDVLKVQNSAQGLLGLINNLLDLTKIEAGKMPLYLERFSLDQLIEEISVTMEPLITKNQNHFVVESGENMGQITTDGSKLRLILTNLLSNACKFTKQGEIRVTTSFNDQENRVAIAVCDTGIGMSESQIARIFKPFEQAEKHTARQYGGSGLGLVITERLCQLLGGGITVTSALGEGACFTVQIPRECAANELEDSLSLE